MHLTVPELGALFLVLAGVFYWLGIFATTRAILAFLGTVAIGTGGFVGRILADVGTWLASAGGALTQWAFGAALVGVPFLIAAVIFIHDLHPKGGKASKRTMWIGMLLGASLAAGAALFPVLGQVTGAIQSLLGGLITFLGSL